MFTIQLYVRIINMLLWENMSGILAIKTYAEVTESQKLLVCTLLSRGEIIPDIRDILVKELNVSITPALLKDVQRRNKVRIQRLVEHEMMTMEVNADMLVARADLTLKKMLNRTLDDLDKRFVADAEYMDGAMSEQDYIRLIQTLYILPPVDLQRIRNHFAAVKGHRTQISAAAKRRAAQEVTIADAPKEKEAAKPLSVDQLKEINDAVKSGRAVDMARIIDPNAPKPLKYGEPIPDNMKPVIK